MFSNNSDSKVSCATGAIDKTTIIIVCIVVSLGVVGGYFMYTQQEKLKKYVEILTNKIEQLNDSVKKCPVISRSNVANTQHCNKSNTTTQGTQTTLSYTQQPKMQLNNISAASQQTQANRQVKLEKENNVVIMDYNQQGNEQYTNNTDENKKKPNNDNGVECDTDNTNSGKCRPLTNTEFEIIYKKSNNNNGVETITSCSESSIKKKKKSKINVSHDDDNIADIIHNDNNGSHGIYIEQSTGGIDGEDGKNACNQSNTAPNASNNTIEEQYESDEQSTNEDSDEHSDELSDSNEQYDDESEQQSNINATDK